MAADILAGYFAEHVGGSYIIWSKHVGEYRNVDITPEYFPRVVGEINKRALQSNFKN